jgi:preprotein translocase subunit SecE
MNREMRRLMEREERLQKRDQGKGVSGKGARAPRATGNVGAAGPVVERKPIWVRLGIFLHEVRQELKKVSWPSREQLTAFTAITLVVTTVLTLIVFALDVTMKEAVIRLLQS